MLDINLTYDPNKVEINYGVATLEPQIAAVMLKSGVIPLNLVDISSRSTNFKDAVMNQLLTNHNNEEAQIVLKTFASAVINCPDDTKETLRILSEYLAPLSYSWGETVLATRAVLRNKRETAGKLLETVASGLSKNLDVRSFRQLLTDSTLGAIGRWYMTEQSSYSL